MNQEWSKLNKTVQMNLKKEATFSQGIGTLLTLRQTLMDELFRMYQELVHDDFNAMPFLRHWIMHIESSIRIQNKIHPIQEETSCMNEC